MGILARVFLLVGLLGMMVGACFQGLPEDEPFACAGDSGCPEGYACVPGTGCVTDPTSYVPFPCTQQGLCPANLTCTPVHGCDAPVVDGPCGSAGCPASTICTVYGTCGQGCDGGAGCPEGRTCDRVTPGGTCLLDCTATGTCPYGLACKSVHHAGKMGCMQEHLTASACSELDVTQCDDAQPFVCPNNLVGPCPNGLYCPEHTACLDVDRCTFCDPGFVETACDGTPCSQDPSRCPSADYFACKAVSSGGNSPYCFDETTGFSGTCTCADGGVISIGCSDPGTCHDRCVAHAMGGG